MFFSRRNIIRLVLLHLFIGLAWGILPAPWHKLRVLLPALSPVFALGIICVARSITLMVLLGLPLLILPFFAGRFFCWNICPMGFVVESVGRLNRWNKGGIRKIPLVGKWLGLFIVGSTLAGYPLFIWLDPLSIFHGFFAVWQTPLTLISSATALGFVTIVILSVVVPNIWCHRLCPLGGIQEWLAQLGRFIRTRKRMDTTEQGIARVSASRRVFMSLVAGGIAGGVSRNLAKRIKPQPQVSGRGRGRGRGGDGRGCGGGGCKDASDSAVIRPPGAVDKVFNALCARCGNCMAVCPYNLIVPDMGRSGIDGFFTPVLLFRSRNAIQEEFCFQECTLCTEVCPTGALQVLTRAEKQQTAIGTAHICKHKCLAWDKLEYCMVCQEFCPYHAIETVARGDIMCPVVDQDKCRGCGACESQCPSLPIAIIVHGKSAQHKLEAPSPYL